MRGVDFKARTEHSENRVEPRALDPQLRINREGISENTVTGSRYPGNVFFRGTADGICASGTESVLHRKRPFVAMNRNAQNLVASVDP